MSDVSQHQAPKQGPTVDSSSDAGFQQSEASPSDSSSTAVQSPPRSRPKPAPPRVQRLPPWRVLLHNDEVNDMGYVVETIIELMRVNPRVALLHTLTAHQRGLALLATTHREYAELLQDQFHCKRLMVSIEPEG